METSLRINILRIHAVNNVDLFYRLHLFSMSELYKQLTGPEVDKTPLAESD